MTVVGSGGMLRTPSIVMTDGPTDPGVRVCSSESADTMLDLMRAVVTSGGTAPLAAIDDYAIAGKTGTAQKAVPGRGYVDGKYTSLFAGVITADSPDYIMLVVLDEVRSGPVAGGYTAGQIFRRAATRLIAHEQLPPG
jgi:cell division protein FtsI/penicillin-binding protein 2